MNRTIAGPRALLVLASAVLAVRGIAGRGADAPGSQTDPPPA